MGILNFFSKPPATEQIIQRITTITNSKIDKKEEFDWLNENYYLEQNQQLTTLYLIQCKLTTTTLEQIVDLIKPCTELKSLLLRNCHLTDVTALKSLTQLTNLDLDNNQIANIEPLASLTQLTDLNLYNNQISNIEPLASLTQLQKVDLYSNKITTIPTWLLSQFTIYVDIESFYDDNNSQTKILLEENPITTPPLEIAEQGNDAIANYYQQLEQSNNTVQDHLFEAKMLVVGEPGAGKTSLVRKISDPNTPLPHDNETTLGIDVLRYDFAIQQQDFPNYSGEQNIDGKQFRVNLWDFGGQEIYLATHRFFLSKRALYTIVSDSRKEDTDFNYWLHIVEMFGGDSPVIIILNEKDNRSHQLDISAL